MHQQDRAATSGKTRGGGVCLFVSNSWCAMSNNKEVSWYCSYLMINCRPHYLPTEFSSILFLAIYLPPQTDAGTKTALNELDKAISKHENAHPEAALLVAGDINPGKHKSVLPPFYQHVTCATTGKKTNSRPPLLHTQRHIHKLHLANRTIILSS